MTQKEYITLQLSNIDKALHAGRHAMDTAEEVQKLYKPQDTQVKDDNYFSMDTFMYFDMSTAQEQIMQLHMLVKDFKTHMILVKIENDKRLLEGGFIPSVDEKIAKIFLKHTLCKMQAQDPNTLVVLQESLDTLKELRKDIENSAPAEN